jgi:phosphoglycerate dehydrogenase-like enzyme
MGTTDLNYFRLNSSSYQKADFSQKENRMFKGLGINLAKDEFSSEILISNTHTDFSKIPLHKLEKTQLFLHPNSGYDNIPANFVRKAPFPILIGNSIRSHGVTEYILSRVFKHFSSIEDSKKWDSTRKWNRKRLADQNVYILGRGHIGTLLEKSLKPLVKKVHFYDPFQGHSNKKPEGIDIVLLASSLNKTSEKIIDREFFKNLNSGWVLVNAARGALINQEDLLLALKEDQLASAYLDVYEKEPFSSESFKDLTNLYCTSHIAGVSSNLDDLIIEFERECASKFLTHRSNQQQFETHFKELLLKNKLGADISFLI